MTRIFCLALLLPAALCAGEVKFVKPGVFLAAEPGASSVVYELPAEPGTAYERMLLQFRMKIGKLQPVFNSILSVTRLGETGYFGLQIRSDKSKTIVDRMDHTQYGEVAPWQENTEYDVRIDYDGRAGNIVIEVLEANGNRLQRLQTSIANRTIRNTGKGLVLTFGLDRVYGKAYYPPLTWTFSDLTATLMQPPR